MKVYYFGCVKRPGHYMFGAKCNDDLPGEANEFIYTNPWGVNVDGGLCQKSVKNGVCHVHHKNGWTAIAFWDNSIDSRPGSNSVFIAEGTLTFDEMLSVANEHFPHIIERFSFPLME